MTLDNIAVLMQKLKFWQVLMLVGFAAPLASHYGWGIDINYAVLIFLGLTGCAVVVRYFPPPEPKKLESPPKISISAQQTGFCSQFVDWTEFAEASKEVGPEDNKKLSDVRIRVKELRLEIGTVQGLLDRDYKNGKHYVRWHKTADGADFIPSE